MGVFLTPFAGNWQQLGDSGDTRSRPASHRCHDRPGAAAGSDGSSATAAAETGAFRAGPGPAVGRWLRADIPHTIPKASGLKIVEAYGAFPFLIFYLGPVIYDTPQRRQMLLVALWSSARIWGSRFCSRWPGLTHSSGPNTSTTSTTASTAGAAAGRLLTRSQRLRALHLRAGVMCRRDQMAWDRPGSPPAASLASVQSARCSPWSGLCGSASSSPPL